jgi:hypothetical protein
MFQGTNRDAQAAPVFDDHFLRRLGPLTFHFHKLRGSALWLPFVFPPAKGGVVEPMFFGKGPDG